MTPGTSVYIFHAYCYLSLASLDAVYAPYWAIFSITPVSAFLAVIISALMVSLALDVSHSLLAPDLLDHFLVQLLMRELNTEAFKFDTLRDPKNL